MTTSTTPCRRQVGPLALAISVACWYGARPWATTAATTPCRHQIGQFQCLAGLAGWYVAGPRLLCTRQWLGHDDFNDPLPPLGVCVFVCLCCLAASANWYSAGLVEG